MTQLNRKIWQHIKAKVCMCAVCRDPQKRSDDGGQRILDNLSPSAVDHSSSVTLKHVAASCKPQINHPDYWINLRTLCAIEFWVGLARQPQSPQCVKECVCVRTCVRACMCVDVASQCFFCLAKMITQRRKCSIYRMSHIEWPDTFHWLCPAKVCLRAGLFWSCKNIKIFLTLNPNL